MLSVQDAYAESDLSFIPSDISNPLYQAFKTWEFSFTHIWNYIVYLIDLLTEIGVIVSLIFVMIGWFWYLLATFQDSAAESAKKTITNALTGLAISSLAWIIVEFVILLITS